jgi:hypothetical protein
MPRGTTLPGIGVSHAPSQHSGFLDTDTGQYAQDTVAKPANPGGLHHDDGGLVHLSICTDLAHTRVDERA